MGIDVAARIEIPDEGFLASLGIGIGRRIERQFRRTGLGTLSSRYAGRRCFGGCRCLPSLYQHTGFARGLQFGKLALMLGRLGRDNAQVIEALVSKLDHVDVQVRLSAVAALDRVATSGNQAAIDKIAELEEQEAGRAVWTQFSREALPIQARLRARMGS